MTKEKLNELLDELHIEKNKWLDMYEIEGIILASGRGIYPDWKHIRTLITDNLDLLIRYGNSSPYGARLTFSNSISIDGMTIRLNSADLIQESVFYPGFRYPQVGDIIRLTHGPKTCLGESIITSASIGANCTILELSKPLPTTRSGMLSFYNPIEYDETLCMHSNPIEGVYMKFHPNMLQNTKKYGGYHELIKCKEISEIILKVVAKKNQKTYTVK